MRTITCQATASSVSAQRNNCITTSAHETLEWSSWRRGEVYKDTQLRCFWILFAEILRSLYSTGRFKIIEVMFPICKTCKVLSFFRLFHPICFLYCSLDSVKSCWSRLRWKHLLRCWWCVSFWWHRHQTWGELKLVILWLDLIHCCHQLGRLTAKIHVLIASTTSLRRWFLDHNFRLPLEFI